jgi:DNA ligase D
MADEDRPSEVRLTNLDQPLFEDAGATKRDLVDYLDAVRDRLVPELTQRPLSVLRVLRGQRPFMQKNLPKYAPDWVRTAKIWAQASRREVAYPLCDDRRTLLWLANQRAVEYHPALFRVGQYEHPSHLVLDLDPPEDGGFALAVRAAGLVREVLAGAGLTGHVKTSGAKGVHVYVPVSATHHEVAAATRALAARAAALDPDLATTEFVREERGGRVFMDSTRAYGATVVSAYSPRVRTGTTVSFPVAWDDLDRVSPADFTVHTAPEQLRNADPWGSQVPAQPLDADLVTEGEAIPVARVQAMHEGKRRAAQKAEDEQAAGE